ncbi:unnamed protein product [Blepharisma stoltei]|uniref:Granulins domain-containing protein n=1 Tax=Blepharisma stoltei TaxID=1481888 RepID=A0AAU9IVS9_9CILI|nr:unnamed protein product [Blepharisma stoltei]
MFLLAFLALAQAQKYYLCDDYGHACKIGTTCCARSDGGYGCCPLSQAVCCADSDGHCCPLGYPVCDIKHKKCTNHLLLGQTKEILIKEPALKSSGVEMAEFVLGFFEGLGSQIGGELVTECFNDVSSALTLITESLDSFGGVTTFDFDLAIQQLSQALTHLSHANYECSTALGPGLAKLEKFFSQISNYESLEKLVLVNALSKSNYIWREWAKIADASSENKGFYFGRGISILFED